MKSGKFKSCPSCHRWRYVIDLPAIVIYYTETILFLWNILLLVRLFHTVRLKHSRDGHHSLRVHNRMSQAMPGNQAIMFNFVKREPGGPSIAYLFSSRKYFLQYPVT